MMEDGMNIYETPAHKRVQEIKGFYWFLAASIFASLFMVFMAWLIAGEGEKYSEVPISIFLSTPVVLVVAVFIQYLQVFKRGPFSAKNGEEKKIRKYIEQEKVKVEKYK